MTPAAEAPTAAATAAAPVPEAFDWVQLKKDLDARGASANAIGDSAIKPLETGLNKFKRKMGENPIVPVGCGLTTLVLCAGLISFATKRSDLSQKMMRARVMAQGFTVMALVGGIIYSIGEKASASNSK